MERKTHRDGWKGEESVKDRITLSKDNIVGFLDGTYTVDMALREAKVSLYSEPCGHGPQRSQGAFSSPA